ncbi:MAG: serpin family protein [Lachnospiraceae bacterium]|nr:serpin family protein [Lachnospiraceae bacterium]
MKKRYLILGLLLTSLLLSACGNKDNGNNDTTDSYQSDLLMEPIPLPEGWEGGAPETTQIVDGETDNDGESSQGQLSFTDSAESTNALGYDLFAALPTDENVCISPYSIEAALAMGANAASDVTLDEMLSVMHVEDLDGFNAGFAASMDKLENDGMDIRVVNSVWYQKDMNTTEDFRSSYLPLLEDQYAAESFDRNLSDAATVDEINDWVKKATNDKIDQIVTDIDDSAYLLLLNAVYFNAKWTVPFAAELTYDETFHGLDGDKEVPFMHMRDKFFKYYEYKGIRAIRLSYSNSSTAMDILIPADPDEDVTALFNALTYEEKKELYQGLTDAEDQLIGNLRLPRFEFSSDALSLRQTFVSLGMAKAFGETADFPVIADNAYISDIVHKTYIRVDEEGTEAAAVTGAMVEAMSLPVGEPIPFEVDMPFVYYISDTSDGTILFLGSMKNIEK